MSNIKLDSLGKPLNGLVIKEEFELYFTQWKQYTNEKGASIKKYKIRYNSVYKKEGLIHPCGLAPAVILYNKED